MGIVRFPVVNISGVPYAVVDEDKLADLIADIANAVPQSRTLTAGVGLAGGGDLSANRTFDLDINELTEDTAPAEGDFLGTYDISVPGHKKTTITNLFAGRAVSGVYTPVRSAEVNLDANVTVAEAQWLRVGSVIVVSGRFTANPTLTATGTSFEITLPVASNLGAAEDLAGTAFCGEIASQGAAILAVPANDTAKVQWVSTDVTNQPWSYIFSYSVI